MTDSRRQRRIWYAVGGVLVVAFLAYGTTSFKSNLTPYVSFDEAAATARKVQVAGGLVENSTNYHDEQQKLLFAMVNDEGETMQVVYDGVKPGNFEEAVQIVAIGSYYDGAFHAEQLLVKCPSKYQGLEEGTLLLFRVQVSDLGYNQADPADGARTAEVVEVAMASPDLLLGAAHPPGTASLHLAYPSRVGSSSLLAIRARERSLVTRTSEAEH